MCEWNETKGGVKKFFDGVILWWYWFLWFITKTQIYEKNGDAQDVCVVVIYKTQKNVLSLWRGIHQ